MRSKSVLVGQTITILAVLGLAASGCDKGEKKKEKGDGSTAAQDDKSTDADAAKDETDAAEVKQHAYTGFDGKTNFAIILPGFRKYTALDDTVKIEALKAKLSDEVIDQLIEQQKKVDPEFNEERFKKGFGREQTSYKVTPLKAGVAKIKIEKPDFGGKGRKDGKGPGGGERPKGAEGDCKGFSRPGGGGAFDGAFERQRKATVLELTITKYDAGAVETGESRYSTDGEGNLKACASCHLSHKEGAPSHQLGRIMDISDEQALTWVTEGELGDRKAPITHTWEFRNAKEKAGIVPYLRSVGIDDVSELTKLYVEQSILEEQECLDAKSTDDKTE